jgi:thiamine pyrophosphate-dependent acetolactate synthase large subunit-like protein
MSEVSGARLVAQQLKRGGIDTIFTVLAGPMIEVLAAAHAEGIRVINCRHEMNASFAASAWGYLNRRPGVVVVGSGPAQTNTVTPMYVATESAMPLVVLGGSASRATAGLGGFQEADQMAFAQPAVKWSQRVDCPERIPELVHLALGKAAAGRPGAVYLDFPADVVGAAVEEDRALLRGREPQVAPPQPDPGGIEAVAEMLASARRPLVLIGKGAAWTDAGAELERLVGRGIPFIASPMGRGTVPDDHEMCMGAARSAAMSGADAVLMVGGRFNWMFQLGRRLPEGVRIAQIDLEPEEMFSAADVEVGIVADCTAALAGVNAALQYRRLAVAESDWVQTLRDESSRNEATLAEQMTSDQRPINHYRLVAEVRDAVDRDAIVTEDGELIMGVARQAMPAFYGRHRLGAGTTGCMGTGFPYAMGAKLARPDQQVVAILGDYAFGAAAMEVETCARWDIPVVIVIANNGGIAAHTIQDRSFPPDAPPIAALLPVDYEKMVEMVGGYAERVVEPDEIGPALRRALASGTVALVNVITDPKARRRGGAYL